MSIDPRSDPPEPARVAMALVTFEPGARTGWHTPPFGQTIIITTGSGWVQQEGSPKENIFASDVVYFKPHVKHGHWRNGNNRHEPYSRTGKRK